MHDILRIKSPWMSFCIYELNRTLGDKRETPVFWVLRVFYLP
jgi:hypothetical protein